MVGWLELRLGLSSGVWIGGRILVGGLVVLVEVGNGLEVDFFWWFWWWKELETKRKREATLV